ncbi:hypothetical protein BROUX41_003937 [Berkeleyomyces rouxiae]|uniref:uncharacterized protein n=1 Tax=Berkeleyomyces rouxiae TaxID=2035830 RepID=UPI003B7CA24E
MRNQSASMPPTHGRPFGPAATARLESVNTIPTAFFLGTEGDMDAMRGRRSNSTVPCHPHSNVLHTTSAKERHKGRSSSIVSSSTSSVTHDFDISQQEENAIPSNNISSSLLASESQERSSIYETDSNFGIETLESLSSRGPVDIGDIDLDLQSTCISQSHPPHPAFKSTPHAASPTCSRFEALTSCSVLSSSSSLGESLAATFSDYCYPSSCNDIDTHTSSNFDVAYSQAPNDRYCYDAESQFIMPTLTLPSRKPFTEVGKTLGRIKILVAGASDTGKSSLIDAITRSCNHIIHVDPVKSSNEGSHSTCQTSLFLETRASSKPQPPWWANVNGKYHSTLNSTQPLNKELLDRNITFIETPSFDVSKKQEARKVISVVSQSLTTALRLSVPLCDSNNGVDVVRLLGSDESYLVSAVLYLISPTGLTKRDVEFLTALQPLANIIPIISRCDTVSVSAISTLKLSIASSLHSAGIRPFVFHPKNLDLSSLVYSISCLSANDSAIVDMDASLDTSLDYQRQLMSSDLSQLVSDIFSASSASRLRYTAAQKAFAWYKSSHSQYSPMVLQILACSWQLGESLVATQPFGGSGQSSFDLNQTFATRRHSYVHVEPWARNLQRSLSNIRLQCHTEVLSEIDDEMDMARSPATGALVQCREVRDCGYSRRTNKTRRDGDSEQLHGNGKRKQRSRVETPNIQQDPLGLLVTMRGIRYIGWSAVQMIGAVGLVGGGFSPGGLPSLDTTL